MSNEKTAGLSRRQILINSALGAGAAIAVAAGARPAAAKSPKNAVQYQGSPKDGKACAGCRWFQPANGGAGACKLVEGDISPNGWCALWSAA